MQHGGGSAPAGFVPMQPGGCVPAGVPMQHGGCVPAGVAMQHGGSDPAGGCVPAGFVPMQHTGGCVPAGFVPMQQTGGCVPAGFVPMPMGGCVPPGFAPMQQQQAGGCAGSIGGIHGIYYPQQPRPHPSAKSLPYGALPSGHPQKRFTEAEWRVKAEEDAAAQLLQQQAEPEKNEDGLTYEEWLALKTQQEEWAAACAEADAESDRNAAFAAEAAKQEAEGEVEPPARKRARGDMGVGSSDGQFLLGCGAIMGNGKSCTNQASSECSNSRCRRHCLRLEEVYGTVYHCAKCSSGVQTNDAKARHERCKRPGPNYGRGRYRSDW